MSCGELLTLRLSRSSSLLGVWGLDSPEDLNRDGLTSTTDLLSVFRLNLSIRKRLMEDLFFLFFSGESPSVKSDGELFVMGLLVM